MNKDLRKLIINSKRVKTGLLFFFPFLFLFILFLKFKISFNSFSFPKPSLSAREVVIKTKIKNMTLEEKVGLLFIIGFNGQELDEETINFFQKHHFNHFLLLAKNIRDEEQLKGLTAALQKVNPGVDLFFVAIDQEGGQVNRINFGNIDNRAQSEIKSSAQAYKIARDRGEALSRLGINVNFAPVVEIIRDENSFLNSQERAFLGQEEEVFLLSQATIKGYQEAGIISVSKHFPGGLGRQSTDPHQSLPVLDISKQELDKDLLPLKYLIKKGKVKTVMSTHILYSQIDRKNPVTTSENFISGILREDLGFKGVIISDDLIMKGISSQLTIEEVAKKAILVGHDLLIISGPSQVQDRVYQTILQAVQSGEISENRVDGSLKRIFKLH